jgi:Protein of unknown function (DUF4232)
MLRLAHLTLRRTTAAIAMTGVAVLIPAIALASPGRPASADGRATAAHGGGAAARCHTGSLTDWIGLPGDGTAGSTYYMLEISNTSRATCTLYGFPGVSALRAGGHQIGSAAGRASYLTERPLTLTPDATVHAVLQITDVSNFTAAACHPVNADGLRVFAPGAFRPQVIPFAFRGCAKPGPVYLHISTTIGGTGIPGAGD